MPSLYKALHPSHSCNNQHACRPIGTDDYDRPTRRSSTQMQLNRSRNRAN